MMCSLESDGNASPSYGSDGGNEVHSVSVISIAFFTPETDTLSMSPGTSREPMTMPPKNNPRPVRLGRG